tara:strand:+ start:361 stop:894 length:534 start_codon:yes stop_codon:yes gene_type:complete
MTNNCVENNCDNLPCGCSATAYTHTCELSNCNTPTERCEELVCSNCVSNCYDKFGYVVNGSNEFIVNNGDRLFETLQKMIIATAGGDCFTKAPLGFMTSGISSTSVNLLWSAPDVTGTYTVQFRVAGAATWTDAITGLSATTYNYNITCLTAATDYEFRVYATSASCPSVTVYASTL